MQSRNKERRAARQEVGRMADELKVSITLSIDHDLAVWLRDAAHEGKIPSQSAAVNDLIAQLRDGKAKLRES